MSTISFYRHPLSGHSHRVELLLSILQLEINVVDVDLLSGEHKQAVFLEKNPLGQVPVIQDEGHYISDSNGILVHLATKYDAARQWLPTESLQAAEVQKFLSLAAGLIAFGPAAARLITVFGAKLNVETTLSRSHDVLSQIESLLNRKEWLVGAKATIADLANYAYIAHAPEGNVSLENYPKIRAWLKRIEHIEGFVPMQSTAVGLAV